MRSMVLESPRQLLMERDLPRPKPGAGEVLVRVTACGVCRTDIHIVDADLTNPKLPLIPGHEIVGTVEELGKGVTGLKKGDKVGIPWLGKTCGVCRYCKRGEENLCDDPTFTGYSRDGGYAEYTVADARYCFAIPEKWSDIHAAPFLCAGLIGWRSLKFAGESKDLGLYGFGASAHIIAQVAAFQGRNVYVFTRDGDAEGQSFARSLGARWAGGSSEKPPVPLAAAIIFAPVGELVPQALKCVGKGGRVICAGIHMSDIPTFPYEILWGERSITSVANLTREDGHEFFKIAAKVAVKTTVSAYNLNQANQAIADIRAGSLNGAAVLRIE